MTGESGTPPASRRAFLAGTGAVAGVAAVAALTGGPLAQPARAAEVDGPSGGYAPVPKSALGPPLNADGYFVGQIHGDLYWVTDSAYQAMFLTTTDGVVIVDAPATIGHNLLRAIGQSMRILKGEVQGLHEDEPESPPSGAPAAVQAPAEVTAGASGEQLARQARTAALQQQIGDLHRAVAMDVGQVHRCRR